MIAFLVWLGCMVGIVAALGVLIALMAMHREFEELLGEIRKCTSA